MVEKLDCEHQIGRRIRLRDLHIFLTVSQRGSMAQAAAQLGVSQPAVSGAIADLERTLGVPLFERSTRGVKPTVYARAMMDRSVAAFDEIKQGIRTLENLADPTAGELWIGCIESVSVLTLPPLLREFMQRYPRVVVHVQRLSSPTPEYRDLCGRNLDLVLGRAPSASDNDADELASEPLFSDQLVVVAGAHTRGARRKRIELSELVNEPWLLTQPDCWTYTAISARAQNSTRKPDDPIDTAPIKPRRCWTLHRGFREFPCLAQRWRLLRQGIADRSSRLHFSDFHHHAQGPGPQSRRAAVHRAPPSPRRDRPPRPTFD